MKKNCKKTIGLEPVFVAMQKGLVSVLAASAQIGGPSHFPAYDTFGSHNYILYFDIKPKDYLSVI